MQWGSDSTCPSSAGSSVCSCTMVISGVVVWLGSSSRKCWQNLGGWQLGATEEIKGLSAFADWRIIASHSQNVGWQCSQAIGSVWQCVPMGEVSTWHRGAHLQCCTQFSFPMSSPHSACIRGFRKAVRGEMVCFSKGDWNKAVLGIQRSPGQSCSLQLDGEN